MESGAFMICPHCEKEFTSKIGYSNHVRRCPKNPNRIHEGLTAEGRERIRRATIQQNKEQWQDLEFRKRHRESMKRAVQENPESYSSANRGRTKQIIVDGIKLQGQWEVDFYNWAKNAGLNPQRPTKAFKYVWNGERWYHPDFYIESLDTYVEVKGYETERDRAKWLHFKERLVIIREQQIQQIRKGCFAGL